MGSKKSKIMKDKENFEMLYETCSPATKSLFNKLKDKIITECNCSDWGYTDKPDFRISNGQTICELIPKKALPAILVMLRVDNYGFKEPKLLQIETVKEGKPGIRWVKFYVENENQINAAGSLIKDVYLAK